MRQMALSYELLSLLEATDLVGTRNAADSTQKTTLLVTGAIPPYWHTFSKPRQNQKVDNSALQ